MSGRLQLLACQLSRRPWIAAPLKPFGTKLHCLIERYSWGMKESQKTEQKNKIKTDQEILVMSRVGDPGPQGKGHSWRINKWENSIVFSIAFSLPAKEYLPLSFPITSFILPRCSCNFTLAAFPTHLWIARLYHRSIFYPSLFATYLLATYFLAISTYAEFLPLHLRWATLPLSKSIN